MTTQLRIFRSNGLEIPLPPGSHRSLEFSVQPIREAAQLARTIDGRLVDLGDAVFRRLEVSISARDQVPGALDNIWPGDALTIHSPERLSEAGGVLTLSREPVPGSILAHASDGSVIAEPEERTVNVPAAAYITYRPMLGVIVASANRSGVEGKAAVSWRMTAEEDGSIEIITAPEPGVISDPTVWAEASGGTVSEHTDADNQTWRIHEFTASGSLEITSAGRIQLLVAAGGGGGGHNKFSIFPGSGAGGGGLYVSFIDAKTGFHPIVVGAGGAPGNDGFSDTDVPNGKKGSSSLAFGIVADGGGEGHGLSTVFDSGMNGGSGSGSILNTLGAPGVGKPYFGHDGGGGFQGANGTTRAGGGGGGAGSPGGDGEIGVKGGDAGAGYDASEFFGAPRFVCCGSASGANTSSPGSTKGAAAVGGSDVGEDGAMNSGNAGGAGDPTSPQGGAGGSGIVAIRYKI